MRPTRLSIRSSKLPLFFFNDTATTEIYTLSLHDALPISRDLLVDERPHGGGPAQPGGADVRKEVRDGRSEEHTSELQSPCNLVCRLLLEKKKQTVTNGLLATSKTRSRAS